MNDIFEMTMKQIYALPEKEFRSLLRSKADEGVDDSLYQEKLALNESNKQLTAQIQTLRIQQDDQMNTNDVDGAMLTEKELKEAYEKQEFVQERVDRLNNKDVELFTVDYGVMEQLETIVKEYYRVKELKERKLIQVKLDELRQLQNEHYYVVESKSSAIRELYTLSKRHVPNTHNMRYPQAFSQLVNYWN